MAKLTEQAADDQEAILSIGGRVDRAANRLRSARELTSAINTAVPGLGLQLAQPTTQLTLDIPEALR